MKVRILVCLMLLVCSLGFASVESLQKEAQTLLQERQKITQKLNEIDTRLIEIQGALKEYQQNDKQKEVKIDN